MEKTFGRGGCYNINKTYIQVLDNQKKKKSNRNKTRFSYLKNFYNPKRCSTFDHYSQVKYCTMESFGNKIRKLREAKGLYLRQLAAFLEIDQALLSKIERNERRAQRNQVEKIAQFFDIPKNQLITSWLSDKVFYEIKDEEFAIDVLKEAEEKIKYGITK